MSFTSNKQHGQLSIDSTLRRRARLSCISRSIGYWFIARKAFDFNTF